MLFYQNTRTMKFFFNWINLNKSRFTSVFILCFIIVITSPKFFFYFSSGLDYSYYWALNFLLANDASVFNTIYFTYGPLGFIKAPLDYGNNAIIALIFTFATRITFASLFLYTSSIYNKLAKNYSFLILLFILLFNASIDNYIMGICLLTALIISKNSIYPLLLIAYAFSIAGCYIKSSIGIAAFAILGIFHLYLLWKKEFKVSLLYAALFISLLFLTGYLLTGKFLYIIHYISSWFTIMTGFNDSSALFPVNNYVLLAISIISFLAIPFVQYTKKSLFFYLLIILSVFLLWKHGMLRQDSSHVKSLFAAIIMIYSTMIIVIKLKKISYLLISVSLLSFLLNIPHLMNYDGYRIDIMGINYFYESTFQFNKQKNDGLKASIASLNHNKLDSTTRKIIANKSIDIIPWDLSYIVANNFNWKMRPTIHHLAFNNTLDSINANFYSSNQKPEYILWEINKDNQGSDFADIDNRYLLNSTPTTFLSIVNHYDISIKKPGYVIFKKSDTTKFLPITTIETDTIKWGKWFDVPAINDGLLMADIDFSNTSLYKLNKFLFKGALFHILYKDEKNKIRRFAFSEGLSEFFINPLLTDIYNDSTEHLIRQIRFENSMPSYISEKISIQWKHIPIKNSDTIASLKRIFAVFKKRVPNIFMYKQNFEKADNKWTGDWDGLSLHDSYTGKQSYRLNQKHPFTPAKKINIHSFLTDTIKTFKVKIDCVFKYERKQDNKAAIVLIVEEPGKPMNWQGYNMTSETKEWTIMSTKASFSKIFSKNAILNIYIWYPGENNCWVDDLQIKIIN